MNKSTKTKILEAYFGIDAILFGKPANKALVGDQLKEYVVTKCALLTNLAELYAGIGYSGDNVSFDNTSSLVKHANRNAKKALTESKAIISDTNVAKMVREELKDFSTQKRLNEDVAAKYVISRRLKNVALDHYLMTEAVDEACQPCLEQWQTKVQLEAYKTMRNALVELVL